MAFLAYYFQNTVGLLFFTYAYGFSNVEVYMFLGPCMHNILQPFIKKKKKHFAT